MKATYIGQPPRPICQNKSCFCSIFCACLSYPPIGCVLSPRAGRPARPTVNPPLPLVIQLQPLVVSSGQLTRTRRLFVIMPRYSTYMVVWVRDNPAGRTINRWMCQQRMRCHRIVGERQVWPLIIHSVTAAPSAQWPMLCFN